MTRLAYCKYGDVVKQISRLDALGSSWPDGGPDIYLAGVMKLIDQDPLIVLSFDNRDSLLKRENIIARVFNRNFSSHIRYGKAFKWVSNSIKTFYLLVKFKPSVILCATTDAILWVCYVSSKVLGVPLVVTRHARLNTETGAVARKICNYINKSIVKNVYMVICHGPYLEAELLEIGVNPHKIIKFDNSYRFLIEKGSIEINAISRITTSNHSEYILYTGQILEQKGVYDLLHACADILKHNNNLKLIYVGEGPAYAGLMEKIREFGLYDKVFLLGRISFEEIPFLVSKCKILVTPTHSSYPESRCKSAIEGIVLGKPVIAPDFGPFPYVIKNGSNGLLYKPDSVDDLQDKIKLLLMDDRLYQSLTEGAEKSGEQLLDSNRTFEQALQTVLNTAAITKQKQI